MPEQIKQKVVPTMSNNNFPKLESDTIEMVNYEHRQMVADKKPFTSPTALDLEKQLDILKHDIEFSWKTILNAQKEINKLEIMQRVNRME